MTARKSMGCGESPKSEPVDLVVRDSEENTTLVVEVKWTDRALRREVVLAQGVTEAALLTLAALACLADESGVVAIQTKELVALTGRQERQLQRYYRELERAGFLRIERSHPRTYFFVDLERVAARPAHNTMRAA